MTLIVVQLSLGILHGQLLSMYLIVDAIVVILQPGAIRPAAQACIAYKRCDRERETDREGHRASLQGCPCAHWCNCSHAANNAQMVYSKLEPDS